MAVESLAMDIVKLSAGQVTIFSTLLSPQVVMMNKLSQPKHFEELSDKDKDLTMFTITKLILKEDVNMVYMALKMKRKVATELLTTYLPTILLLLITFVTIFFDKDLFGDAIAVNLTIMLVMTTIFTSKIEELPSTSDTKMIDIWLIGCLLVPFTEVVLRTLIEVLGNSDHCSSLEENETSKNPERRKARKDVSSTQGSTSFSVTQVMVLDNVVSLLFNEYICISGHTFSK